MLGADILGSILSAVDTSVGVGGFPLLPPPLWLRFRFIHRYLESLNASKTTFLVCNQPQGVAAASKECILRFRPLFSRSELNTDMPTRPATPCRTPLCPALSTRSGLCALHLREHERLRERHNTFARSLYASVEWKALRASVREVEPLCRVCFESVPQRARLAVCCDHILSLKTHPHLGLVRSNIQPLCRPCHEAKTRLEQVNQNEEDDQ